VPSNYPSIALANTTIGAFMATLDTSILTVSLPTIAHDLHVGVALTLWILMGYTVTIAALFFPVGRLSDLHGRVRFYLLGFAVFTLGSALSGVALSGAMLFGGRLVQGVGAACLWSNSMAIITDAFPAKRRGFALGVNQVANLAGGLGGLALGGLITATLGWRWIFFVNVPVGAFGTVWTYLALRDVGQRAHPQPFDYPGLLTVTGGIVSVLLGLTEVIQGERGPLAPALVGIGLAILALFIAVERRLEHPLLDLDLFAARAFTFGNAALFTNALSQGALMFLLTFAFQGIRGAGPLRAGLLLMPATAGVLLLAPVAGALSDRIGQRVLASAGLAVAAVAFFLLSRTPVTGRYEPIALALVLDGLGNGMFQAPNTSSIMGAVPAERRGVAAATRSFLFSSGQVLSIGLAFSVVSAAMGAGRLERFLAGAAVHGATAAAEPFAQGLRVALLLSASLSAAGAIFSYLRGGKGLSRGPADPSPVLASVQR
jgi:EmrB/QacA subfamily drug resistance transporter